MKESLHKITQNLPGTASEEEADSNRNVGFHVMMPNIVHQVLVSLLLQFRPLRGNSILPPPVILGHDDLSYMRQNFCQIKIPQTYEFMKLRNSVISIILPRVVTGLLRPF